MLPLVRLDALEGLLDRSLLEERLIATISGFFGILALVLACMGLYGVMAYSVARRTSEIGVRIALGAASADVQRMVVRETAERWASDPKQTTSAMPASDFRSGVHSRLSQATFSTI